MQSRPILMIILGALAFSIPSHAQPTQPASAMGDEKSDAEQEKRASEWVATLGLNDPAKEARVHDVIATHLKAVRDWHNAHPYTLVPEGINPITGKKLSTLDRQLIA